METEELKLSRAPGRILSWLLTAFLALGCLLACFNLSRSTVLLGSMFETLGIDAAPATRHLVANYSWIYPLFFGVAGISLIVKDFLIESPRRRLLATAIIFAAILGFSGLAHHILYLSYPDMIHRLNYPK
jgi:hypothetical protein